GFSGRNDSLACNIKSLFGDLIEFANPWLGLSLWAVYAGEGQNMTQKSNGDRVLKQTKVCIQRITELKLPAGTRIRVNNNKHNLAPSQPEWMKYRCDTLLQQEFKYDLLSFNSEHFATFIRYGQAVCNQQSIAIITTFLSHKNILALIPHPNNSLPYQPFLWCVPPASQ
uniref:LRAT domain-containing protein n=1 Tax=Cynoglossus semilaevis TaxID=244447 RepID=A0A3P8UPI0_CYNSE